MISKKFIYLYGIFLFLMLSCSPVNSEDDMTVFIFNEPLIYSNVSECKKSSTGLSFISNGKKYELYGKYGYAFKKGSRVGVLIDGDLFQIGGDTLYIHRSWELK